MLFGVFSRCDSMGEICNGLLAVQGKLNHLGLNSSSAKSTIGDGLRERDNDFFKDFYFLMLKDFEPLLSVSRIDKISFYKLYIFDSSTIRVFSIMIKGVGRNPKDQGKKKERSKFICLFSKQKLLLQENILRRRLLIP
ncbi:MAG: DUF4372 domain-containing protein [Flavobacterium sp.]|nr:DUF4372 domain-containing protein [Flavobacterium sp.]